MSFISNFRPKQRSDHEVRLDQDEPDFVDGKEDEVEQPVEEASEEPADEVEEVPSETPALEKETQTDSEKEALREMVSILKGELADIREELRSVRSQPSEQPKVAQPDPFSEDLFDDTIGNPQALRQAIQDVVRDVLEPRLKEFRDELPQVARQETQAMTAQERAKKEFFERYPKLATHEDYVAYVAQNMNPSVRTIEKVAETAARALGVNLEASEEPAKSKETKPALPKVNNSGGRPAQNKVTPLFDPEAAGVLAQRR